MLALAVLLAGCAATGSRQAARAPKEPVDAVGRYRAFVSAHLDLPDEQLIRILEGEIPVGMSKEDTRSFYGEALSFYSSPTGMMEVWFYEDHYVGFDKTDKVMKFGRY